MLVCEYLAYFYTLHRSNVKAAFPDLVFILCVIQKKAFIQMLECHLSSGLTFNLSLGLNREAKNPFIKPLGRRGLRDGEHSVDTSL